MASVSDIRSTPTHEATMGDYINYMIANNKEEFDRAREKGEMAVFSFDTNNPQKLIREDDFINDNVFEEKVKDQNQEAMKWKELPTGVIFKILEVVEVDGKFDRSRILTLKNREGEKIRVWACSGLNREKEPLKGAYLRSTGYKVSKKSKQEYFSYDLVRK